MKKLPKTHHASLARLIDGNRTRAAIIRTIIKHNGYISISEIAKQLQLARSTVIRHIYVLKYLRLIQHEGKVRGGRWRVANCSRWDINEFMGIPLKLSCHLNRFATADDLDWDEPNDNGMKRGSGCGMKNNEFGTIKHECSTKQSQENMFITVYDSANNHRCPPK
jgi:DNA-binding transcriptional ArsR family regulator